MLPAIDAASWHAAGDGQTVGSSERWLWAGDTALHQIVGDETGVSRSESAHSGQFGVETRRIGGNNGE